MIEHIFIKDETNNKRYVQINLDDLSAHEEEWEDLLDLIIAESRRDDEKIPLEEVVAKLKAEGLYDL